MPEYGKCSPYDLNCRNKTCTHVNPVVEPERVHILDTTTSNFIPFRVVFGVRNDIMGQPLTQYGKVVAFYDRRHNGYTEYGQFVADYSYSDFMDIPRHGSLPLSGNIRAWMIDVENIRLIQMWLTRF